MEKWECVENDIVIEYNADGKEFLVRLDGEPEGTGLVIGLTDYLYALTLSAPIPIEALMMLP